MINKNNMNWKYFFNALFVIALIVLFWAVVISVALIILYTNY